MNNVVMDKKAPPEHDSFNVLHESFNPDFDWYLSLSDDICVATTSSDSKTIELLNHKVKIETVDTRL